MSAARLIAPVFVRLLSIARRAMQHSTTTVMRSLGLASCIASGIAAISWTVFSGPKIIPYTGNFIGRAAMAVGALSGDAAFEPLLTFRLMLILQILCTGIFAILLWICTSQSAKRSVWTETTLVALQMAIGLVSYPDLLIILAAQVAFFLPRRRAGGWLVLLVLMFAASRVPFVIGSAKVQIVCNVPDIQLPSLMINTGLHAGWAITWQIFAFCVGYIAAAEQRSRIRLASAHAELVGTRQLLADAIRASERMRIARDLHDTVGHHLTALNLHLDLAVRQAGVQVVEPLQTSRNLVQRLLAEVRAVVSIERGGQAIGLRQALQTLCAGVPSPRIVLSFDAEAEIRTPTFAHAIFCCVQEAIGALHRSDIIAISLSDKRDGLAICITEEGKRMRKTNEGDSMQNIRKRVEALGGTLTCGSGQDGGSRIGIWLPQAGSTP